MKTFALVLSSISVVALATALAGCGDDAKSGAPSDGDAGDAMPIGDPGPAQSEGGGTPDASAKNDAASPSDASAPTDAGSDAADAADANVPTTFVSPNGDDTADGTRAHPVKTIAHAIAIGVADIVFLDGTFDATSEGTPTAGFGSISIPAGSRLRADHDGQAIVDGQSPIGDPDARIAFTINGGASVSGLTFRHFRSAVSVNGGTTSLEGIVFDTCSGSPLAVRGGANVTLTPGSAAVYAVNAPGTGFADVAAASSLHVKGGSLANQTTNDGIALFYLENGGSIALENVSVKTIAGTGIEASDNANISIVGTTFDGVGAAFGYGAIYLNGNGIVLSMSGSTLTHSSGGGIRNNANDAKVTIDGSSITGSVASADPIGANAEGVHLTSQLANKCSFTATNSHFDGNGGGALVSCGGAIAISGSTFASNGGNGLEVDLIAGATLKLRSSDLGANGDRGLFVTGAADVGAIDLGIFGDDGKNALHDNATTNLDDAWGGLATAVGNTWNANVENADANGKYAAIGGGATLDETSVNGANFRVTSGTLRVAQNP